MLHQARQRKWLRNSAVGPLASAVLAIVLYSVTLGGTYVYDDVMIVRDDPRVHHLHDWFRVWKTDYFDGGIDNLYRPITSSSYALEWWLHGDRPWIFHGVNILLNALAAALVAEFTRRMVTQNAGSEVTPSAGPEVELPGSCEYLGDRRRDEDDHRANTAGLCAGLLFAAHPVHVEAVANIVGRAELLCTSLIFAGLILICRRPLTTARVISVIFVGIIALLCKEQGVLQPLLWVFFFLFLWDSTSATASERGALKILFLAITWIWAGYLILREQFLKFEWDRTFVDPIMQPLLLSHGVDRVLVPVVLIGHYTALLLWPRHLSADYSGDVIGSTAHFSDPYLWIGFIASGFWLVALILCLKDFKPPRRRDAEKNDSFSFLRLGVSSVQNLSLENRFILFCLLSLAVTYGIVANILTLIAINFAERLIYLPSAFILMIVGVLLARIPTKIRAVFLTTVLVLASIRTVSAARDWNNPMILFQHDLAAQPKSVQLHLLVAQQYHGHGNISAANATLRDLCEQYPNYWRAWMFRANEDMDDGDLADAERSLHRAKDLNTIPLLLAPLARLAELQAATRPTESHKVP